MNAWIRTGAALVLAVTAVRGGSAWKSYASIREVRGLAVVDDRVWGATTGGVVRVNAASAAIETVFTNVDGLAALDIRSVAADVDGGVVCGDADVGMSRWDPSVRRWVGTILSADGFEAAGIAVAAAGTYYLAGPSGVSLVRNGEIRETYNDFGFMLNADVRAVLLDADGFLWVGADGGVARSDERPDVSNLALPNLMDPDGWTLADSSVLPDGSVTALFESGGVLWAGTENGIGRREYGVWSVSRASGFVRAFAEYAGTLYAATTAGVYAYDGAAWTGVTTAGLPETHVRGLAFSAGGRMWAGLNSFGFAYRDPDDASWTVLDAEARGPRTNLVERIAIEGDTAVWTGGTGEYAISRLTAASGIWRNYDKNASGRVTSIRIDPLGNRWFGTWGRGAYRCAPSGAWHHYDASNSFLSTSTSADANYTVIGDILASVDGTVLLANYGDGVDGAVLRSDTSMQSGTEFYGKVKGSYHYSAMARDQNGYVWVGIGLHDGKGGAALDASGTDTVLAFGELKGVSNGFVNRIAVDGEGRTWIATNSGIAMYRDIALERTPAFGRVKTPYLNNLLLDGIIVTDIDFDSSGNVWAATDGSGIYQLSAAGDVLNNYTATNSGLVHNRVNGVAVNRRTGTVWLGTYNGVSRFASAFTPPRTAFDGLEVFPNPFKPREHGAVAFRGIIAGSQLHVFTAGGQLVRSLTAAAADGMAVSWDGLNGAGAPVAAGLYHYVLFDAGSGASARGSFAVVR